MSNSATFGRFFFPGHRPIATASNACNVHKYFYEISYCSSYTFRVSCVLNWNTRHCLGRLESSEESSTMINTCEDPAMITDHAQNILKWTKDVYNARKLSSNNLFWINARLWNSFVMNEKSCWKFKIRACPVPQISITQYAPTCIKSIGFVMYR